MILPLVNPDGFVSSRNAFDPGDTLFGQEPNVTLVESIIPPGGIFAYRRKNCDGEILGPQLPCELAWGVDNNRNYGNLWGGPAARSDVTSQSYHGPGPRSEPETQAVWNYVRTHQVTTLVSIHNVAALVLRPPGVSGSGLAPDEARMKAIGDAMGNAAGYTSQYGYQLYDTAGTTEDDSYAATGGYGFTVEMGPPDGNFHMPYATGFIADWTGQNAYASGRGGLREALLLAAEAAATPADHAILRGTAPAGKVLRLKRAFQTRTSPYCEKGIEPVVTLSRSRTSGCRAICLTGQKPPMAIDDVLDATTTVPAVGQLRLARQPVHAPVRRCRRRHRGLRADLRGRRRRGARAAHADDRPRPGRDAQPRLRRRRRRRSRAAAPRAPAADRRGDRPAAVGRRRQRGLQAAAAKLAKPRRAEQHARAQVRRLHAQRDPAGQRDAGAVGAALCERRFGI